MTVDEAIKTAIEYEIKVRDVYAESYKKAQNEDGKRVMKMMTKEEQQHVDYLKSKLKEWEETGNVTPTELKTIVPSATRIGESVNQLKTHVTAESKRVKNQESEKRMLERALDMEKETSAFYERMVKEMKDDAQKLFARFLEIEQGHLLLVEAELDSVDGMGFWFGVQEFNLEAG